MSFKRDGDDPGLLSALNHQRVSDLLGENIPEDEAILLSNGRFSCRICIQRPVFDTIAVLAIHRKGKKHLHELTKYLECKQRLELRGKKEPSSQSQTANTYVRKYLKKLPRQSPFYKKVETMRENYGGSTSSSNAVDTQNHNAVKSKSSQLAYSLKKTGSPNLKFYESGWLQGKDGDWYKNPDVEFDSDDDLQPS